MGTTKSSQAFSAEEKEAMRAAVAEAKRAKQADAAAAEAAAVDEAIAAMPPADRKIAQKVHDLVLAAAPKVGIRTWYSMPAYTKEGKVVVFFKPAEKFKSRYCTLGFEDALRSTTARSSRRRTRSKASAPPRRRRSPLWSRRLLGRSRRKVNDDLRRLASPPPASALHQRNVDQGVEFDKHACILVRGKHVRWRILKFLR